MGHDAKAYDGLRLALRDRRREQQEYRRGKAVAEFVNLSAKPKVLAEHEQRLEENRRNPRVAIYLLGIPKADIIQGLRDLGNVKKAMEMRPPRKLRHWLGPARIFLLCGGGLVAIALFGLSHR